MEKIRGKDNTRKDNRRKKKEHIIIGDFNIRIGKLKGAEEEEGGMERKNKDKVSSKEIRI